MLKRFYGKLCARFSKKIATAIVALTLTCSIALTGTVAFLVVKKAITNTFEPGEIELTVNNTTGVITNSADSDVGVYILVKLVVNYQNNDGNVYYIAPVEGRDYTVSSLLDTNWIQSGDYYYYKNPVEPGTATTTVPVTVTFKPGTDSEGNSNQYAGYTLTVQYLAEAIQSNPTTAVAESWNATVDSNGLITQIN